MPKNATKIDGTKRERRSVIVLPPSNSYVEACELNECSEMSSSCLIFGRKTVPHCTADPDDTVKLDNRAFTHTYARAHTHTGKLLSNYVL